MGIVIRLHVEQRFHLHAERLLDQQRHLGRQSRVAVDEVGEGGAAHVVSRYAGGSAVWLGFDFRRL